MGRGFGEKSGKFHGGVLSPHTWGTLSLEKGLGDAGRFIPTSVGNFLCVIDRFDGI